MRPGAWWQSYEGAGGSGGLCGGGVCDRLADLRVVGVAVTGYPIPRINDVDPRAATGSVRVLMQGGKKCCLTVPVGAPVGRRDVWRPEQAAQASRRAGEDRDDAENFRIVREAQIEAGVRYGVDPTLLKRPSYAKVSALNDARSHAMAVCAAKGVPARIVAAAFGVQQGTVFKRRRGMGQQQVGNMGLAKGSSSTR